MEGPAFREFLPKPLEESLQVGLRSALALGADGAEAHLTVVRSRRAKVQNGVLDELTTSKRGGLGLRVIRGGRVGLATTTDLGRRDFSDLFARAFELAALGDPDPWLRQATPTGIDDLPPRHSEALEALTPEDRIQRALELEATARSFSPSVRAVREASWEDSTEASLLLTQTGVRCADFGSSCSASLELAVEAAGDRQAAWHWEAARNFNDLDLSTLAKEAVQKGLRKLNPEPLRGGRYTVILHPEVTVELLGLVAEMLSAAEVLKGRSLFAGRIGACVASRELTLIDDGRLLLSPGRAALGAQPWDDEGVPTRRNVLIAKGELHSYLHTLASAAEMGCLPTASAGRELGANPSVRTFNLFPEPGAISPEQLIGQVGNGVLITEVMGLHTVDPVSGELSVGASGLRIRNGELGGPVDRFTFSGNLRDFLTRIVGVGNDLRWYGSHAGLSLLLEEMALGGA